MLYSVTALSAVASFLAGDASSLHAAASSRSNGVTMSKVARNPNIGKLQGEARHAVSRQNLRLRAVSACAMRLKITAADI